MAENPTPMKDGAKQFWMLSERTNEAVDMHLKRRPQKKNGTQRWYLTQSLAGRKIILTWTLRGQVECVRYIEVTEIRNNVMVVDIRWFEMPSYVIRLFYWEGNKLMESKVRKTQACKHRHSNITVTFCMCFA
jgi:hypothetical protein